MNYRLFKAINGLSGNAAGDAIMRFAAKDLIYLAYAALVLACAVRLWQRRFWPVAGAVVAVLLAVGLRHVAAWLHQEKRPFQIHPAHVLIAASPGQSFPSDHATRAFAVALILLVFFSVRWGAAASALAAVIAFARVYVGVHYPGDVAAGLLVATIAVAAVALPVRVIRRRSPAMAGTASGRPMSGGGGI